MRKVPLTTSGAQRMREEIRQLKSEARPRVIQAIAEARGHGDLRENAEYHAAKEEQGFIEGRIRELEQQLANAEVIDVSRLSGSGKVVFGTTVELLDETDGRTVSYQIVGEYEANIEAGQVSITSPIARALIGKLEGDQVTVVAPGGDRIYEIIAVRYS
jgi:transcription elongation factor GreA